ncbi:hypothetical protein [Fictibacillus phosphorivorans]|uniref:hypothetical protein n=1 Tax=Fictibacillus phosphorivorans TaxID=1221500 RepID=UPI000A431A04|nr:hypothetical protein [Fictibacillus phosphorivorans]
MKEDFYMKLINEFGRLFEEYIKCNDNKRKQRILDEIKQIGKQLKEERDGLK